MSTPLQSQLQSLVLERSPSLLESPSSARRSGRRSFRSEPFLIGVAGGTASGVCLARKQLRCNHADACLLEAAGGRIMLLL